MHSLAPAAAAAAPAARFALTLRKVCRLGAVPMGRTNASVYVVIRVEAREDATRLSICGVEGPMPSGNCRGACGQIGMHLRPGDFATFAPGWSRRRVARLLAIWDRWHLNDMRAGSPAQEAYLRDHPVEVAYPASHFEAASAALESVGLNPDPADGYRYGSTWRVEEVPAEIIAELRELPDADRAPAWV